MDIRLRLLTAEIAILTAIAGLFSTNTAEWTKVYERRLYAEMALNLWRSGNEQKTVEEIPTGAYPIPARTPGVEEAPLVLAGEVVSVEPQTSEETPIQQQTAETQAVETVPASSPAEAETERPTEAAPVYTPTAETAPVYTVDGERLDPGVADYLYRRLCESNIGWFYEYALCIAYQESRFCLTAVNQDNKLDMGLFQFRSIYWQENCASTGVAYGDIFNPYLQIDVFTVLMARRLTQYGCSVYEAISRHKQSDFGTYDQEYVNQVMQHMGRMAYGR